MVLILECVVAVGAQGDDLPDVVALEEFRVAGGNPVEDVLIAQPSSRGLRSISPPCPGSQRKGLRPNDLYEGGKDISHPPV